MSNLNKEDLQKSDFYKAVEFVLRHEGFYSNDSLDPGGETKFGISKRAYPKLDIKNLTRDEAIDIYKLDFWDKLPSELPAPIHCVLFDCAVNTGIGRAIRILQTAIKASPDGKWGRFSQFALNKMPVNDVLTKFATERIMFYSALSTFDRFGKGWVNRTISTIIEFKE